MDVPNADEALDRLKRGNERFRTGRTSGRGGAGWRGDEIIHGQHPFAVVLGCADSRVPTEIIFDAGPGELFVVRVAGNVANASSIASIEFAVAQLGTKLIVVTAHQDCGAVGAAIEGDEASTNLRHLTGHIRPALDPPTRDVDVVARRNARMSAKRLVSESDIIRRATEEAGVKIVTAFFHLSNGEVEFDRSSMDQ